MTKHDELVSFGYREYIERDVVKETEKAYLVSYMVGRRKEFKWVPKSICKPISEEHQALFDAIPEEYRRMLKKQINVPTYFLHTPAECHEDSARVRKAMVAKNN